jgi:hypothetical protein
MQKAKPSAKQKTKTGQAKPRMASYHCSVKVGGKGHAAAHAHYIAREGAYVGRERYEDLEATHYGNMPSWAEHNPSHFWQAADAHERANGATYREIEIALPRELVPEQRRDLVEDFIKKEIGESHAYQWAIHTPKAALEKGEQPHAHIMYSERTHDGLMRDPEQYFKRYNAKAPERGGCRKDSAGTEERLHETRQRWADVQNEHLALHGHDARVDHRSLKQQGIEREPEQHLGGAGVRKLNSAEVTALLERRAAEGEQERARLQQTVSIIDLSGDLEKAITERDNRQELQQIITAGKNDFRALFAQHKRAEQEKKRREEAKAAELKAELERQQRIAHEKAEEQRWMKLRAESPGFAEKLTAYAAIKEKAAQEGLTPEQSAAVMTRVRENIDKRMEQEAAEARRIQEEKQQQERERQRRIERNHDRGMSR